MAVTMLLNRATVGARLALDNESEGGGCLFSKFEDVAPVAFARGFGGRGLLLPCLYISK